VLVAHDAEAGAACDRIIRMRDVAPDVERVMNERPVTAGSAESALSPR
jgi:hypothetical protein